MRIESQNSILSSEYKQTHLLQILKVFVVVCLLHLLLHLEIENIVN